MTRRGAEIKKVADPKKNGHLFPTNFFLPANLNKSVLQQFAGYWTRREYSRFDSRFLSHILLDIDSFFSLSSPPELWHWVTGVCSLKYCYCNIRFPNKWALLVYSVNKKNLLNTITASLTFLLIRKVKILMTSWLKEFSSFGPSDVCLIRIMFIFSSLSCWNFFSWGFVQ